LVDVCGYELPTNLQNFTQKDLTTVKIFQNVLQGASFFLKHCALFEIGPEIRCRLRNPLFECVKLLLLLWKRCSWF